MAVYPGTVMGMEDTRGDTPFPAYSGAVEFGVMADVSDRQYGGYGRIVGTVKEKASPSNHPLARRVCLFHQTSKLLVREMWSNAAGDYAFERLDPTQKFFAVAFDHTGNYRGVIADQLSPTL